MAEAVGLHTRLKPGAEERYDAAHAAVWPEVLDATHRVGVAKWLIFRGGLDLFRYIECEDYERAIAERAGDPVNERRQSEMAPMMEIAHDYSAACSDRLPVVFELR